MSGWHSGPRAFRLEFGDAAAAKDGRREGPQDGGAGKAACGVLPAWLACSPSLAQTRPPSLGPNFSAGGAPRGPGGEPVSVALQNLL